MEPEADTEMEGDMEVGIEMEPEGERASGEAKRTKGTEPLPAEAVSCLGI